MSNVKPLPVAPDSVHVWRGFRSETKTPQEFTQFLGSVFLPACSLLQPNAGLHAYIPSLPKRDGKPDSVPDQTALMFWTTPQTYHNAFKTVAVRAYTNLHGDAYREGSSAQFPILLANTVKAEQPYFLINQPADWMLGRVHHLVGAKPAGQSTADFLDMVYKWAADVRDNAPKGLEGALLCAGEVYVVAWLLWNLEATTADPLNALAEQVEPWLNTNADHYVMPAGLWDEWPGISLSYPNSINIQLTRPGDA